jgi:type IV secretion system protein TrbG
MHKKIILTSVIHILFSNVLVLAAAQKSPAPILKKSRPARLAAEQSTAWANTATATVAAGEAGRVVVVFGQSAPKLICTPLHLCAIELEPGEVVNKIDAGDSLRWKITPAIIGDGANQTVHVIIKPTDFDIETNIKIATNRRMYDIDLYSVQGEKFVRRLAFSYPENDKRLWEAQRTAAARQAAQITATLPALTVERLNFNYTIGGKAAGKPLRVFDDSRKTYIQMGPNFNHQEAPVLVLIGPNGEEQLVNYSLKNGYYLIDKVIDRAALILGVGRHQSRVTIMRGCVRRNFFGICTQ